MKVKSFLIGVFLGILTPLLDLLLIVAFIKEGTLRNVINELVLTRSMSGLISIAAVPNLLLFFVFLKQNRDETAKGILAATLIIALITVLIKSTP